jgi:drug/metabolite transporter (DMT)-like permease
MTPAAKRQRTRILLAFASVYIIWGSTYLFIKYAIESIPPFMLGASRFVVAGALLYAIALWRGGKHAGPRDFRLAMLTGVLMLGMGNGAVMWAELSVPSGVVALIVSAVPIMIVLIDWLRPQGVRPRSAVFVGLALGFAGMVVLIGPRAIVGRGNVDEIGAAILMVGCTSWAFGSILTRGKSSAASPFIFSALQMLAAGGAMLVASLALGEPWRFSLGDVTAKSAWSWVYLALAGSVIGYTAYVYLLGAVSATKASTYAYVNPVIAVVLGWAFANEPIGVRTLVAAAIILAGVAMITMKQASAHPTGEHPVPAPEQRPESGPNRNAA